MTHSFPTLRSSDLPATIAAVRPLVERAMRALSRLTSFHPFMLGEAISHADLFAFYTLDVGERVTRFVYDWSLLDSISGLSQWHAMMTDRPSSRIVLADFSIAFAARSEEHTSELQSLMRISYAVFCLKKKKKQTDNHTEPYQT